MNLLYVNAASIQGKGKAPARLRGSLLAACIRRPMILQNLSGGVRAYASCSRWRPGMPGTLGAVRHS